METKTHKTNEARGARFTIEDMKHAMLWMKYNSHLEPEDYFSGQLIESLIQDKLQDHVRVV